MTRPPTDVVLEHYGRRYIERFGRLPRKRDLDPSLARSLITWFGDVETVIYALNAWFDSLDPWYAEQGFALPRCFGALQRLIGTGHVMPNRGTPHEQELTRKLCAAMFRERPRLRLVRPGDES